MIRRGFLLPKSKKHKHYNIISILVPTFSVLLVVAVYFLLEPSTTGLVVYGPEEATKLVNADVTLSTKKGEIIPPGALVQIWIDGNKASMTIKDFIFKTGKEYSLDNGELFGYTGKGFTGDHTYTLTLSDFPIDRNIEKGEHRFITRIIYRNQVLYEKENRIMISEQS